MISTTQNRRKGERGNALFLILIAVALFAALSYAVTQSGRGSGTVDKEQSLIAAAQVTQFPAAVRTAVTRMIITGTDIPDVDLDRTVAGVADNSVFDKAGGGVVYQKPPKSGVVDTDYSFKSAPDTAIGGFFIMDVGSNDEGIDSREAFAYVTMSESACAAINRGLNLGGAVSDIQTQTATVVNLTSANEGTPTQEGGTSNLTDDAASSTIFTFDGYLDGSTNGPQAFACVSNTTGGGAPYVYYHAVIEQ